MNIGEYDMNLSDYTASCVIQPVKQKMFQFNFKQSQSINLHDIRYNQNHQNKNWKPVLYSKKLYSEPKFILSLQRKKARIISGIRDCQIQQHQKKFLGMVGSKVKHNSYKFMPTRTLLNPQFNVSSFVRKNQVNLNKVQLKSKKNPNMNFSLMYIAERKKLIEYQCRSKSKDKQKLVNSRAMTSSFRQKGSDSPYLHMIIADASNKKTFNRPRTSCTSERYNRNSRKIQRPRSQIQ